MLNTNLEKLKKLGSQNIPECYVIVPVSLHVIVSVPNLRYKMCLNSIADMIDGFCIL